jgi:hypothetical protein
MRKSQLINHYAPRDQVCRVLWTWEQCQMWSWATLNCSVPFSDSTRWSMHSLKKNLLEWRWIWTISFGIMWSLANSFSINQLGLWWPISKSSWRIWILRGCRIQTQIDPESSDESIVRIIVWSFVISIFQCFVAGIHSCWASPQARITQCWEPGSCHSCQSLHSHLRVRAILWNKPCPWQGKVGGKYLYQTPIFGQTWQMLCKSICQSSSPCANLSHHPWRITKTDPLLLSSVRQGISPAVSQLTSRNPL